MFNEALCLAAAIMATVSPAAADAAEQAYAIESTGTVVTFEVSNFGIAKRQGVFNTVAGTVMLDTQAGDGSVEIVVDARSIQAGDAATQSLVLGKSFLNVEEYSQIAYKAEHVVFEGGRPAWMQGQLTLLGVSKTVLLTISGYRCPGATEAEERAPARPKSAAAASNGCVLDAEATFRRSEFGMNRYMGLVSDVVRLAIHSSLTAAG